jgi:hypothetical protein
MPEFLSQMLANHFLVKLLLTPLIIILATVVSRRWGEGVGGLMIGLPLRMLIATTILIAITTAASLLGPKWSGLLSPFPVFTFVMVAFAHSQGGSAAAGRFIRGVVRGLFGYLAFFLVVSQLVTQGNLAVAYGLAAVVALGVNGLSLVA